MLLLVSKMDECLVIIALRLFFAYLHMVSNSPIRPSCVAENAKEIYFLEQLDVVRNYPLYTKILYDENV